ncbi:MAG: phosphodiester glycosidase family protein [Muribaculaceae bacterium]|nr:phosphodiester glycosidase family protein [Muribaculaceae bacterium]
MKKSLLLLLGAVAVTTSTAFAETISINGKDYDATFLIDRDLGPGVRYTRLRLPSYPLNVNLLRIDVSNPYNSVEVTQANDRLYGTESLVSAAKRQTKPGHVALAGANANFWCVSGQPPYSDQMVGVTYNGNLQNGKIITETNSKDDKYNGGLKHTGIVGISESGKAYSNNGFSWAGWITSAKTDSLEIYQCNKVVRDGEIGLYNSFYGPTRTFKCVNPYTGTDNKLHFEVVNGDATEVYLTMNEGEKWSAGDPMAFTVKEVKTNSGNGTLGSYDLALVGRGANAAALAKLAAGDVLTVRYSWINSSGTEIKMKNLIGGNAQVMKNGEMTSYATSESYNSQVYSRTGYGISEDKKTLYVIVIDKATDPVYGTSAGCSTTVMCAIAKHFGCTNMTNFDAGGSAEMFVGDRIVNKTTESAPRAVANGMLAYSIAPEDNTVARLEFYDYELKSPIYATSTPRSIAFPQYGAVLNAEF